MAQDSLFRLRERIHSVLAQGLQFASSGELEQFAQDLSALNLTQPATLVMQIRESVANGAVSQKDAEALIKVSQILAHAEIQVSEANPVVPDRLMAVPGCPAVLIDLELQQESSGLREIIYIANPFVRNHQFVKYVKNATYEELVTSIEIAWYDYSLANALVEGLRARPEEALKLAQIALDYRKNLVMQRVALKVLEMVGLSPGYKLTVLDFLTTVFKKVKEPMKYIVRKTRARIEGTYPAYRMAQQKYFNDHAQVMRQLSSRKKGDRSKAIRALGKTKDPCFTDVLMQMFDDPEREVVNAAIENLVKIGGFAAIPTLAHMLKQEPSVTVFSHRAAEALYGFGDRRGLEYFLLRKLMFPLEAYVQLAKFGTLAIAPFLRTLKRVKEPEQYRDGFAAIFGLFRSEQFAGKILEYAQQDTQFAKQLMMILHAVYPDQSEKILKRTQGKGDIMQALVSTILGPNPHKIIAHLRHRYIINNILAAPDGTHVVTLDANGNVTVWNTKKWKKKISFPLQTSRQYYYIHQIALTPDGKYLVVTNNLHNTVDLLEFGKWENIFASLKHETEVYSVGVTGDGPYILGGGRDTVKVWEFGTWKEVAELSGHSNGIEVVKAVPGKSYVITGDRNGLIQVWAQTGWKKVADLKVNGTIANSVAVSPDGAFVIAVETLARYLETTVKIWETETWRETVLTIPSRTPITSFVFTPDGKYIIAGSDAIKFLKMSNWQEVLRLASRDTRALAVTPDGKYIIAGMNVWKVDLSAVE